jgi:hypothetical protein
MFYQSSNIFNNVEHLNFFIISTSMGHRKNMNSFILNSYFQNPQGQLHGSNKTYQVSREKNCLSTKHVFECTKKCNDAKC